MCCRRCACDITSNPPPTHHLPTCTHACLRRPRPAPAGKRHQQNLAKRAARDAADAPVQPAPQRRVAIKKTVRIGRPGYRVTKQFDPEAGSRGLLFQASNPATARVSTLPAPQLQ